MIETAHPLSVASNSIGEGRGNVFLFFFFLKKKKEITIYVSQGWGSLVGCRLRGRTESDTTEVT